MYTRLAQNHHEKYQDFAVLMRYYQAKAGT